MKWRYTILIVKFILKKLYIKNTLRLHIKDHIKERITIMTEVYDKKCELGILFGETC